MGMLQRNRITAEQSIAYASGHPVGWLSRCSSSLSVPAPAQVDIGNMIAGIPLHVQDVTLDLEGGIWAPGADGTLTQQQIMSAAPAFNKIVSSLHVQRMDTRITALNLPIANPGLIDLCRRVLSVDILGGAYHTISSAQLKPEGIAGYVNGWVTNYGKWNWPPSRVTFGVWLENTWEWLVKAFDAVMDAGANIHWILESPLHDPTPAVPLLRHLIPS